MNLAYLVQSEAISEEAAELLKLLVKAGYNIFISGGTGSGKTTFLNALSEYIPEGERVITIEDSAELQLNNIKNLVRLETRPANGQGAQEIAAKANGEKNHLGGDKIHRLSGRASSISYCLRFLTRVE